MLFSLFVYAVPTVLFALATVDNCSIKGSLPWNPDETDCISAQP